MFLKIFWQLYFIILDSLKFPHILLYKSKYILLWRGSYIARVTGSPDCQRSPWHKKSYCCVLLRGQSSLDASPLVPILPCGTPIQPCHHIFIISLLSLPYDPAQQLTQKYMCKKRFCKWNEEATWKHWVPEVDRKATVK